MPGRSRVGESQTAVFCLKSAQYPALASKAGGNTEALAKADAVSTPDAASSECFSVEVA